MIKIPTLKNEWVKDINTILEKSLASVDPFQCVSKAIVLKENILELTNTKIDLELINNVYIIGIGKAAIPMSKAVVRKFEKKITGGFLISKHQLDESGELIKNSVQINLGNHPIPDEQSISCAKKLEHFVSRINQNDLIITLISGGGSALVSLPYTGISLNDLRVLTDILLKSGATIQEINTIRKHIDQIKGV